MPRFAPEFADCPIVLQRIRVLGQQATDYGGTAPQIRFRSSSRRNGRGGAIQEILACGHFKYTPPLVEECGSTTSNLAAFVGLIHVIVTTGVRTRYWRVDQSSGYMSPLIVKAI